MRFFDGWVMVGILPIQVNDQRPNEEKQRAWVELSLSVLPNAPRGGFFTAGAQQGPREICQAVGECDALSYIKALRKNLPPPKVAAGPSRSP